MKRQEFSAASIDRLTADKMADPYTLGLSIEVTRGGRKIWSYRRRFAGTAKIVSLKLGAFPRHSIAAAREWAGQLNKQIDLGVDPREVIRAEKAHVAMTVAAAHLIYMEVLTRGDRKTLKPRTLCDKQVLFDRDIKPRLGAKPIADLTDDECWDAVYDKARASKDRANKMAGELSCFLRWCSGREGKMSGIELAAHPAPTLNSNWFATGPKANKRFLSTDELKWFFQALVGEALFYRRGFILLLLTAARRNELFAAPSSELREGVWILSPERSKNGEVNYVALGSWGRQLALTNHEWLFPSPRLDGPQLYGWFAARDRVHARMEAVAGREIARWHFHDLRRTFRSHARRLGIDRDIAELMMNHKRRGIEAIYNRNEELELRAQGFAIWEAFLVDLVIELALVEKLNVPAEIPDPPSG